MKKIISVITAISLAGCSFTATTAPSNGPTASQVATTALPPAIEAATYLYLTKTVLPANRGNTALALNAVATAAAAFVTTGATFTPTQLQAYLASAVPSTQYVYAASAINLFISEFQLYYPSTSVTVTPTTNLAIVKAVAQGIQAGVALANSDTTSTKKVWSIN